MKSIKDTLDTIRDIISTLPVEIDIARLLTPAEEETQEIPEELL